MDQQEKLQIVKDIVNSTRICMLCTLDDQGALYARPMATQRIDDDLTVYFFTRSDSEKVSEIKGDSDVNLSYSKPGSNNYLSIAGKASLIDDMSLKRELWNPMSKAWFPDGVESDKLQVIKVDASKAEFWNASESKLEMFWNIGKALLTGRKYSGSAEDHGEVRV